MTDHRTNDEIRGLAPTVDMLAAKDDDVLSNFYVTAFRDAIDGNSNGAVACGIAATLLHQRGLLVGIDAAILAAAGE